MIQKFRNAISSRLRRRSYALNGLDLRLLPYLNFRHGFFIEVGANDGIRQSNTLFFEKYMGWRGLLIEAIPALAEQCRQNRPRCIVENCALVSSDYPEETVEMRYCNLMSVVKGGTRNEEEQIESGTRFLHKNENTYTVTVPARTLSDVLNQHGIGHIELLSLDVEGYEPEVLKGLDFPHHRPHFMLIEVGSRNDIEVIINAWYQPTAILTMNSNYQDILYKRRDE